MDLRGVIKTHNTARDTTRLQLLGDGRVTALGAVRVDELDAVEHARVEPQPPLVVHVELEARGRVGRALDRVEPRHGERACVETTTKTCGGASGLVESLLHHDEE